MTGPLYLPSTEVTTINKILCLLNYQSFIYDFNISICTWKSLKRILPCIFTVACPFTYSISQYFPCLFMKANLILFENYVAYHGCTLHHLTSNFFYLFTIINYVTINILINMSQNTQVCIFWNRSLIMKFLSQDYVYFIFCQILPNGSPEQVLPFRFITGMCCFSHIFNVSSILSFCCFVSSEDYQSFRFCHTDSKRLIPIFICIPDYQ